MNLEALGVAYAPLKGLDWVLAGVLIAIVAIVTWESWEARKGNDRPVLKIVAGIMLSFLAGLIVAQGFGLLRSPASSYRWILDFFLGLLGLGHSFKLLGGFRHVKWVNDEMPKKTDD
jgi:hypothetical protein